MPALVSFAVGCATLDGYPVPPPPPAPEDPWSWGRAAERHDMPEVVAESGPAAGAIGMYRRYLRREGFQCRMFPSCSAFSLESYERHGALAGLLLTVDRLLVRENSEVPEHYPMVVVDGDALFWDPVPR